LTTAVRHLGLIFLYSLLSFQSVYRQSPEFNPAQVYSVTRLRADLQWLQKTLYQVHPALFRYSSKHSFDSVFDSIERSIDHPLTENQFLSLLENLNGFIRDGHTQFLPSESASTFDNRHGRFFPFGIRIIDEGLYIIQNYSADSLIRSGSQIFSINGIESHSILAELESKQIRDGYNKTYPRWINEHYFPGYYSFAFGQPREFKIKYRDPSGKTRLAIVNALSRDSIRLVREIRYQRGLPQRTIGEGILMTEIENKRTAILKVSTFDPDLLGSLYKQEYKAVFDSLFTRIESKGISKLILDLRDNQGGDFPPARYLLSYLFRRPVPFLLGGKESAMVEPRAHAYSGKLLVLMNGGSFSATAILISILKDAKRGMFIGEETGGNQCVISGDPEEHQLPNTKIRIFVSTVNYQISTERNTGHGIMPVYFAHPVLQDCLEEKDPAKDLAIKLMSGQ
jgi:hypothetical protein